MSDPVPLYKQIDGHVYVLQSYTNEETQKLLSALVLLKAYAASDMSIKELNEVRKLIDKTTASLNWWRRA